MKCKINLDYYSGKDQYTDGDIEDEIFQMVKSKKNFLEFLKNDNRWPVLYHLSSVRENIIAWYPFKKNKDFLEIGGGCGAITGLLCRKGRKVISIELSKKRATIIANRYKEYSNLEIIAGNLNDINLKEKFDYITMIGVLEYAGAFTKSTNPYLAFLIKVKSFLRPGGKLFIAIENRFGMKYWAGAKEDHTGKEFDGITGYLENNHVKTFGKIELENLLNTSGFSFQEFFYPHPDYKMPVEIFSDDHLPSPHHLMTLSQNYDQERYHLFLESLAFKGIIENNQFNFFANSFLVVCS